MAYAYCQHPRCNAGISFPDLRAAVTGKSECYAGHENQLYDPQDALVGLLEDMQEEIKELQATVARLEDRVVGLESGL